ncbi:CPBP family intramembrane glutamic endopeptidase [Levilactobacillus tujiorum]|uniref:CPBP family intramembrane metalloprotease n=1 Tax=Levilactobacillus tujiorum TaxID=2912243 RepID=A0ABX1L8K7_9LACO|nr:type II CAAX endopeptidase family protein [Levilactobacillus tujiorum]MCH5465614.1 CPBP family intramembrane metalloprotease [Levilactobacillus tujiorum]NLR12974.1 CPBP family intramembrane metalloprotease [Lactobacillus sp. HBUAS51387]NLR30608.1 CPBP family intramembrane metalloprotease [Levilactobacillus tujiorum]
MNSLNKAINWLLDWVLRDLKWLGFLLLYLIDSLFLTLATQQASHGSATNRTIGSMLIYSGLLLAFITWRYQKQLQQNNPRLFGRTPFTGKTVSQLIGFFLLMLAIQYSWSILITTHILPSPANQTAINQQVIQLPFWNLAYAVLLAPVIEELIFRGIFLNYFFSKNTKLMNFLGIFVSGLIFGFMHVSSFTPTLIMYSALGWVLGYSYLHFRDIRYDMTLHFLNNALSLI